MKSLKSVLFKAIVALAAVAPSLVQAEKLSKHTDADGFEDYYWKTTVKVSRGQEHTFWIKGLTENSAVWDMSVYWETEDDSVWASESADSYFG